MIHSVKRKCNKISGSLLEELTIEVNHLFCYDDASEPKLELISGEMNQFKGVCHLTSMKRTTISFPDDLTERIFALRKDERFTRCSYSELIRQLAERGLAMLDAERGQDSA